MKTLKWTGRMLFLLAMLGISGVVAIMFSVSAFNAATGAHIGHEVPGVLMDKAEELIMKHARAKAMDVGSENILPIMKSVPVIPETHAVKRGEWLSKIAVAHGVTVAAMVKANKGMYPSLEKNPGLIHPGWKLSIPTANAVINPSPEKSAVAKAMKQKVYPETIAKAVPRDKHRALSNPGTHPRIVKKGHRGASRHPETGLKLKVSPEISGKYWDDSWARKPVGERLKLFESAWGDLFIKSSKTEVGWVPPIALAALTWVECRGKIRCLSDMGAEGPVQILPGTQRLLGLKKGEAYDPEKAVPAAAKYLRMGYNEHKGSHESPTLLAFAHYYGGPGYADRLARQKSDLRRNEYIRAINGSIELFGKYGVFTEDVFRVPTESS